MLPFKRCAHRHPRLPKPDAYIFNSIDLLRRNKEGRQIPRQPRTEGCAEKKGVKSVSLIDLKKKKEKKKKKKKKKKGRRRRKKERKGNVKPRWQ